MATLLYIRLHVPIPSDCTHNVSRRYDLDLRIKEHQQIALVLAYMAVTEPGPNLQNQQFRR